MQLKDKEEQKLSKISSKLNLAIQPKELTENTAKNPAFKAQPSPNTLSPGIKALLVLLVFFSTMTLMGLGALFAFSIFNSFDTDTGPSDPCEEMQLEDTTQPR